MSVLSWVLFPNCRVCPSTLCAIRCSLVSLIIGDPHYLLPGRVMQATLRCEMRKSGEACEICRSAFGLSCYGHVLVTPLLNPNHDHWLRYPLSRIQIFDITTDARPWMVFPYSREALSVFNSREPIRDRDTKSRKQQRRFHAVSGCEPSRVLFSGYPSEDTFTYALDIPSACRVSSNEWSIPPQSGATRGHIQSYSSTDQATWPCAGDRCFIRTPLSTFSSALNNYTTRDFHVRTGSTIFVSVVVSVALHTQLWIPYIGCRRGSGSHNVDSNYSWIFECGSPWSRGFISDHVLKMVFWVAEKRLWQNDNQ